MENSMQSKQMIRIAMRLTESIIEILKEELNGKDKVSNAKKQKKSNRVRKASRQNNFGNIYCGSNQKIKRQVSLMSYRGPSGSLQLKNFTT